MEYKPKKKLTEAEKEKKRAHYRENKEEILAHQHTEAYIENRRQQRRGNSKYNNYHKFDMAERRQDEEFNEMCKRSRRNHYKKNAEKVKEQVRQYQKANADKMKEYKREYMREYMRKKRAKEREEKA